MMMPTSGREFVEPALNFALVSPFADIGVAEELAAGAWSLFGLEGFFVIALGTNGLVLLPKIESGHSTAFLSDFQPLWLRPAFSASDSAATGLRDTANR